jgi:hypothetical protein
VEFVAILQGPDPNKIFFQKNTKCYLALGGGSLEKEKNVCA